MPIIRSTQSVDFTVHASVFRSYVAPRMGSSELCAWRLIVPASQRGVPHRPTREEILFILDGTLTIVLDGVKDTAGAGDIVFVPANAEITVEGGNTETNVWVTTTPGLEAIMTDGTRISPPWAN